MRDTKIGIAYLRSRHLVVNHDPRDPARLACGGKLPLSYTPNLDNPFTFNHYRDIALDGCQRCRKSREFSRIQFNASTTVAKLIKWILPFRPEGATVNKQDWVEFAWNQGFRPLTKYLAPEKAPEPEGVDCTHCGEHVSDNWIVIRGSKVGADDDYLCPPCLEKVQDQKSHDVVFLPIKEIDGEHYWVHEVEPVDPAKELKLAARFAHEALDDLLTYGPRLLPERRNVLNHVRAALNKALSNNPIKEEETRP